jgi:hypothetical protein
VGVPEIEPLLLLNVSPDGREGEIEKLLTAPPELLTLTVEIALFALTDCVALESEIEGAAVASFVRNVVIEDCLLGIWELFEYLTSV